MTPVKDTIGTLIDAEKTKAGRAKLVLAEQAAIAYYYDMVKTITKKQLCGRDAADWPDIQDMKSAVKVFNQSCANQKRAFLFQGNINDPYDLFQFAGQVAA